MKMLNSSKPDDFIKAAELLIKYADNILSNPTNTKYRKIKTTNENFLKNIVKTTGAVECVKAMGFFVENDFYVLPEESCLDKLKRIRNELHKQCEKIKLRELLVKKGIPNNFNIPQISNQSEKNFYLRLLTNFERMYVYEDVNLQKKARDLLDYEKFKNKAMSKLLESNLDSSYLDELILLQLLDWFKNDFFKWMDQPECSVCHKATTFEQYGTPSSEELSFGGERVEIFICKLCGKQERFPRYNDPQKLLETRVGRCGEFANCFALFCRALYFETRYILDVGDHVWVEVYSNRSKKWLHCDPCENACDKPLLYEKGWGKLLTYVIAFSINNIQDVTWRYSSDHKALLSRRKECRESWLVKSIVELRNRRFFDLNLTKSEQNEIIKRTVVELVELMEKPKETSEKLAGRTTGSVEWRVMRGEMGSLTPFQPVVLTPNTFEIESNSMKLSYCCSKDEYVRGSGQSVKGWKNLLFCSENMMRKEEKDWKKSYLCRQPSTSRGKVVWKIDLKNCKKLVTKISVNVNSECFENGKVDWTLNNDLGLNRNLEPGKNTTVSFEGCETVELTALLQGGMGENNWQHAQIFRQDLNSCSNALTIELLLENKN